METLKFKRKKRQLKDRKNPLVYAFWNLVNKICISVRFQDFQVIGRHNLPRSGPFLLVSNHITRWDGLLVYELIGRPANFMVSPNELKGTQGAVLLSMGSFPADPRTDFINHALTLFRKGEGIVVFPEGNIFRDGSTHPFKAGAARIALAARSQGIDLPVLPCAIHYAENGELARIALGEAVYLSDYNFSSQEEQNQAIRSLSQRMHREVCFLRAGLGSLQDNLSLFFGSVKLNWSSLIPPVFENISKAAKVNAGACDLDTTVNKLALIAKVSAEQDPMHHMEQKEQKRKVS